MFGLGEEGCVARNENGVGTDLIDNNQENLFFKGKRGNGGVKLQKTDKKYAQPLRLTMC